MFRSRAREYRSLCLESCPLLKMAIREAPNTRMQRHLTELRVQVSDEFQISSSMRLKENMVPLLASLARYRLRIKPVIQPRTTIRLFNKRHLTRNFWS